MFKNIWILMNFSSTKLNSPIQNWAQVWECELNSSLNPVYIIAPLWDPLSWIIYPDMIFKKTQLKLRTLKVINLNFVLELQEQKTDKSPFPMQLGHFNPTHPKIKIELKLIKTIDLNLLYKHSKFKLDLTFFLWSCCIFFLIINQIQEPLISIIFQ